MQCLTMYLTRVYLGLKLFASHFRALYLRTVVSYEAYSTMEVRWRNMIKNLFIREKVFAGISETDTLVLMDTNLPILQIFVQVW